MKPIIQNDGAGVPRYVIFPSGAPVDSPDRQLPKRKLASS